VATSVGLLLKVRQIQKLPHRILAVSRVSHAAGMFIALADQAIRQAVLLKRAALD
jgi:hypothetical protein